MFDKHSMLCFFHDVWVRYCFTNEAPTNIDRDMHEHSCESHVPPHGWTHKSGGVNMTLYDILAEGAIALSVTLSGGALFASWKLIDSWLMSLSVDATHGWSKHGWSKQRCSWCYLRVFWGYYVRAMFTPTMCSRVRLMSLVSAKNTLLLREPLPRRPAVETVFRSLRWFICKCIYIYIYVYICIYTYVYTHSLCVCMYVCIYIYICIHI